MKRVFLPKRGSAFLTFLGFQYESIDGNHRFVVFRELDVKEWKCFVVPLTSQEYFVLAKGTFISIFI